MTKSHTPLTTSKYGKCCRECGSLHTKKDGFMRNKQRYRCCSCGYVFQNKGRKSPRVESLLWKQYSIGKQTYKQLARQYGVSIRTIQRRLDSVTFKAKKVQPWSCVLLIDTTYFWRDFGVMVMRNALTKVILRISIVAHESYDQYHDDVAFLQSEWWDIQAIVCDGKKWLLGGFGEIPTQMCIFHQVAIITRYVTKRPKLQPNKELRKLALLLKQTDKETFTHELKQYGERWKSFLSEKTVFSSWRWEYTHKKTRSAFRSLQTNLQYLFVWYDYLWQIDIPTTTAELEWLFGHMKPKISLHRWQRKDRKIRLILSLMQD